MIASEKNVSLFGNNADFLDASFSSYMNENNPAMLKLTPINSKEKVEDGEIGIFEAEKYFKGVMDEQLPTPRTSQAINPKFTSHYPKENQIQNEEPPKLKTRSATPSVRSESSWKSQSGGMNSYNRRIPRYQKEKTSGARSLLVSLGCNCNDNASVKIVEKKVHVKELPKPSTKFIGGFTDNKMGTKKEDYFVFPVLNAFPNAKTGVPKMEESDITHVKTRRNSSEACGSPVLEKGKKCFSFERKLTMFDWDGVTPRAENIMENNDAGSDTSSDLFEIESISSNLARQVSKGGSSNVKNEYTPSEASIAWSVVTASVAGFSITSDNKDNKPTSRTSPNLERMIKGTGGILSGCTNLKSVRVANERLVVGGSNKLAVTGSAAATAQCRLNSVGTIMKFQTDKKPTHGRGWFYKGARGGTSHG